MSNYTVTHVGNLTTYIPPKDGATRGTVVIESDVRTYKFGNAQTKESAATTIVQPTESDDELARKVMEHVMAARQRGKKQ